MPTSFDQRLIIHSRRFTQEGTQMRAAIEYALSAPGKRLRPKFVQEVAQKVGLNEAVTDYLAYSIEMVHQFSLIHDDLPCMDNDDFRRGLPTTHKKFNEGQALLAGDTLLSIAYETLFLCSEHVAPAHLLSAVTHFSSCLGAFGMMGGQSLELETPSPSRETLMKIHEMKTTALFRAAILMPLLMKGEARGSENFKKHDDYAHAFGFAFQIADDLEDEAQDAAQMTKNILSLSPDRESARKLALDRLKSSPIGSQFSNTALLVQKLQSIK